LKALIWATSPGGWRTATKVDLLAELVRAGLATAKAERVMAGKRALEDRGGAAGAGNPKVRRTLPVKDGSRRAMSVI
jgi:hypothetical protein